MISKAEGDYLCMPLSNGRHGVFWRAFAQPAVYHLIAEFVDERRAHAYCVVENDMEDSGDRGSFGVPARTSEPPPRPRLPVASAPPLAVPEVEPHVAPLIAGTAYSRRGERMKRISNMVERLIAELPDLWRDYPDGITSKLVMARYGLIYGDAVEVLRTAGRSGAAQWVQTRKRPPTFGLLPLSAPVPALKCENRSHQVHAAMWMQRDAHDCVEAPQRDIARWANIPLGTLGLAVSELIQNGAVMVARPAVLGRNYKPAAYQVLKAPEPTE